MASDIDLPFLPSAAQIRRREFASVRRGYDADQVRDYLAQVAEQVEGLESQLREARLQEGTMDGPSGPPPGPPPSEDPYERLSKRLTTLLAAADQEAEGILTEARADAARMLNESRTEADHIRVDAQARAEEARQEGSELLEKAKDESDRVLVGLSARREDLVQHLQDMQSRLIGVAKELEVAIDEPALAKAKAEDTPRATNAAAVASAPAPTPARADVPATAVRHDEMDDPVDSLEGMLSDEAIEMPGIPPLELDFEADEDEE
jgi:cell division initiation protein